MDSTVSGHDVFSIGAPSTICFQQSGWFFSIGSGGPRYLFQSYYVQDSIDARKYPWRRTHEKVPKSLQFLIEALTKPRYVVFDAYTSTS